MGSKGRAFSVVRLLGSTPKIRLSSCVTGVAGDDEVVSGWELPAVWAGAAQAQANRINRIAVYCRRNPAITVRCAAGRSRLPKLSHFTWLGVAFRNRCELCNPGRGDIRWREGQTGS